MTTDPPRAGAGSQLAFHGPLSEQRAASLVGELAARRPATVLDIGCGWAELMLRILAAAPGAIGTGVDNDGEDIRRARDNATARGLDSRVTFAAGQARDYLASASGPADLVLNVGAYHALGTIPEALAEIRERVNPGANMWPGITADDCTDLATLAERTIAAGFRPLRIQTATRESGKSSSQGSRSSGRNGFSPIPATRELARSGPSSIRPGTSGCAAIATSSVSPI